MAPCAINQWFVWKQCVLYHISAIPIKIFCVFGYFFNRFSWYSCINHPLLLISLGKATASGERTIIRQLCSSKNIGKFTGFYYTASMSAQTITPVLLGFIFNATLVWRALPVYASVLLLLSAVVFIVFVKNIKAVKVANAKGLEALDGD